MLKPGKRRNPYTPQITDNREDNAEEGSPLVQEFFVPQILTSKQGNALVADIINTQLRLPQGNSFRRDNPTPGIASIVIIQTDPNSVRMVITGTTSAPSSQITQRNAQGITLSISRAEGTTALPRLTPSPPPAQPQPGPERTAQKPNVLVPNPEVTIDGKPVPAVGTDQPVNPTPLLLPRAIAPPVGDIAVSNSDASPEIIDLGTTERVPRLVLRDAPMREVLALLAASLNPVKTGNPLLRYLLGCQLIVVYKGFRFLLGSGPTRAAGLNLAFSTAAPSSGGQQGQPAPNAADGAANEGSRISLDIEDESVTDIFNYVQRISSLQANRSGRTIFVGARLTNQARDVIVRSFRLNQVTVGVALNFLVGFGAESAVSRERTITSVNAVPVGGSTPTATQTQTSTETRIETQRIDFQDSVPLLRGLQALGDERTNSVTLIGSPKQIDLATAQLIQLDARRRQVAVNVKIVDINLVATENFNTSFSFGIGDTFFSSDAGAASLNFGGVNPPSSSQVRTNTFSPPITGNPLPGTNQPLLDVRPDAPFGSTPNGPRPPFGSNSNPLAPGLTGSGFQLPTLFQFPRRFLSLLQAQVVSGNAKILTDPTLIVQEERQANVNLTQQVVGNITTTFSTSEGVSRETETVEKENVGLTLSIRIERIDDNGFVGLSVAPVVRAPQAPYQTENGQILLVSERSLNSGLIRLRDSQTLILSGIIQDSDRTTVNKVPILGDIPILGALFRSTNRENTRQEVIVLLTPQILVDSAGSEFGYNYTPGPEARQMLEMRRQNSQIPGNHFRKSSKKR